ncbi:MAG: hypothetical protein AAF962_05140 [Actinomycetota bacterium]
MVPSTTGRSNPSGLSVTMAVRMCWDCSEIDHDAMYGAGAAGAVTGPWSCRWCRCPDYELVEVRI